MIRTVYLEEFVANINIIKYNSIEIVLIIQFNILNNLRLLKFINYESFSHDNWFFLKKWNFLFIEGIDRGVTLTNKGP